MLAGHGLDVVVLTGRIESDERISGVTLCDSPQLFNRDASMDVRLGEALTSRPAVVHLHQIDDPDVVARMRTVAPVVSSAHGYSACTSGVYYFRPGQECTRAHGPMCVVNLVARGCAHTRHPKSLPARYARVTGRLRALVQADLVVSYSSSVDRHLAANGLTRRAIVPYFPTMAHKSGSGHAARRRVVFAGRVVAPKGVDVLLRAASDVDGEFVICGDGTRLEPMRRLARRLKLEQRVRFTGWLDAEDLAQELADASVVVMPSLWPEPFGLVGIEALAAGRPVVASSTGGIPDWLEDGVSGLCVAPGDPGALARALNELLADPQRQQAMGQAGKESVAARFSERSHLQALLHGYDAARSSWQAAQGA